MTVRGPSVAPGADALSTIARIRPGRPARSNAGCGPGSGTSGRRSRADRPWGTHVPPLGTEVAGEVCLAATRRPTRMWHARRSTSINCMPH
jgi:hypothetical protein